MEDEEIDNEMFVNMIEKSVLITVDKLVIWCTYTVFSVVWYYYYNYTIIYNISHIIKDSQIVILPFIP